MCSKKSLSLVKFQCLLFVAGLILTCGFGQNEKPSEMFEGSKGLRKEYARGQESEFVTATSGRRFNWKTTPEEEMTFYEDKEDPLARKSAKVEEEVAAGSDDNKGGILLSAENSAKLPLRQPRTMSSVVRRKSNSKGNKKRRRDKELRKLRLRARESNSTITSKFEKSSLRINDTIGIAENQIKRKREGNNAREQIKNKFGYDRSFRGKRLKETREERRKLRLERRRRRKNRERKRRNRIKQNGGRSGGHSKLQKKLDEVPAALFLNKFKGPNYNDTSFLIDGFPNVTVHGEAKEEIRTSSKTLQKSIAVPKEMQWEVNPEENEIRSNFSKLAESDVKELLLSAKSKETKSSERPDRVVDKSRISQSTSSQTNANESSVLDDDPSPEKRLSKSRPSKFVSSRFDAEKMLGYARSKYPIYDLENDVFAQTLKDYNVYVTSGRKKDVPSVYGFLSVPKGSSLEVDNNDTNLMADTPLSKRNDFYPVSRTVDVRITKKNFAIAEDDATTLTQTSDDANVKGDISCINGTFLPAPLARHALIKYVKSSAPGHEYLEADYECTPGSYMASVTNRLLCKDRRWIGQIPRCKVRQNPDDACAESSCDQVCKVIDGRTECSCYKGFRLDGRRCIDVNECDEDDGGCEYKCLNTPGSYRCDCPKGMRQGEDKYSCMDINECLLNNGHGPCQDTCRNLDGGYECSCEGLPDTTLSSDNHTCDDAGPCSTNNTGCSHTCLSTMGRVFCLCPDGFMLEDDWKTCQDVDECAVPDLQTEVCQYGCVNTPGSYRCAEPLELKDQPILDSSAVTCLSGYELSEDGSCADIDECSVNNGACTEVCVNTNGSFFCACDSNEKILSADGKSCIDIIDVACPPVNPAGRGYLMCSRLMTPRPWRGRRRIVNRPGTKCYLKCPRGYELHGEYDLTCRADGTWDGPKHGECVRYAMPRLECPENIVTEVPPGRSEAFVSFQQPSTDLDWSRYVYSKPAWGMRLEVSLKPGLHEVIFFARHPVSKKQTSCVLRVIVKEGEAPRVKYCPGNTEIVGRNDTIVTWMEPIFTDNVKVTRISSNRSPGRPFEIGEHRIEYKASDEAGWTTRCVFNVTIRQE